MSTAVRPDVFTFSWLQSRQTNLHADTDDLAGLVAVGFREVELDFFYDIQVVRRKHMRRFVLEGLRLRSERDGRVVHGPASLTLVTWHVGYYCLRLTLEGLEGADPVLDEDVVHSLHGIEHEEECSFEVNGRIGPDDFTVTGNVRRVFDWFGAYVHEVLASRRPTFGQLDAWSADFEAGLAYRQRRAARGELSVLYPSTFGSHAELLWSDPADVPAQPASWAPALLAPVRDGERHAHDIDEMSGSRWWLLSEFQSLLVRNADGGLDAGVRAGDPARVQMIEYLALRRGALAAIQRQTQLAAAERRPVARREVADWTWFLSAVTDDYVIGGWSASMLEQIKRLLRDSESLRDVFDLENQVRRNVEAFQSRLDAESDRTGVMIAVFFGIVAATSLLPLAQVVYSRVSDVPVDDYETFPAAHPAAFLTLSVLLVGAIGCVAVFLLLRARFLRPPRRVPHRRRLAALVRRGVGRR